MCCLQGRRGGENDKYIYIHNLIIAIRNIGRGNQRIMKTMTLVSDGDWCVRVREGIQKTASSEYYT